MKRPATIDGKAVLWFYGNAQEDYSPEQRLAGEIMDAYAVVACPAAPTGIMLMAYYHMISEPVPRWHANPWSARPAMSKMLRELGAVRSASRGTGQVQG